MIMCRILFTNIVSMIAGVVRNGQKWTEMDRNGQKSTEIDRNGQKWTACFIELFHSLTFHIVPVSSLAVSLFKWLECPSTSARSLLFPGCQPPRIKVGRQVRSRFKLWANLQCFEPCHRRLHTPAADPVIKWASCWGPTDAITPLPAAR